MPTKAQSEQRSKYLEPNQFKKGQISRETAAKNGRKGAIASNKVQKEKKIIKDEILKRMNEKDWDEMILNLIEKSKVNTKDFEVLRDSIGQKPAQDVNVQGETDVTIRVGVTND